MSAAGSLYEHAMAAGYPNVAEYATELEEILEHIVRADQLYRDDPDDIRVAIGRAREIVESWGPT